MPESIISTEQFLTASEVASELRCSKAHVYKLMNGIEGLTKLPHLMLGSRKKIVPRSDLEAWKRRNIKGKLSSDSEMNTVDAVA